MLSTISLPRPNFTLCISNPSTSSITAVLSPFHFSPHISKPKSLTSSSRSSMKRMCQLRPMCISKTPFRRMRRPRRRIRGKSRSQGPQGGLSGRMFVASQFFPFFLGVSSYLPHHPPFRGGCSCPLSPLLIPLRSYLYILSLLLQSNDDKTT